MEKWSKEYHRYMIAKSCYEAAINMSDWEWADRVEPEYQAAKEAYENSK